MNTSTGVHDSHLPDQPTAGTAGVEALLSRALDQLRHLEPRADDLRHVVAKRALDAALIRDAAERRNLEVIRLSSQAQLIRRGPHTIGFFQNMSSALTALDRQVTNDKLLTKRLLAQGGLPVARGVVASTVDRALDAFRDIGPPVVVKPIVGSGGRGVTVDIRDEEELRTAADEALSRSRRLLVEEMVAGIDLRIMTVAGRAVAAMLRVPANVVGDGVSTIRELAEQKNAIRAGNAYLRHCPITFTPFTEHHLALRGLTPDSVPAQGQRVYLHYKANLSSGGDSYEIIDVVHPEILRLAERAAACVETAYHAGVDILLERFDRPPGEQRCIVCELNLNNEMPIHVFPLYGTPSATDDETIEGYFFRALDQIESGPHRIELGPSDTAAAAEPRRDGSPQADQDAGTVPATDDDSHIPERPLLDALATQAAAVPDAPPPDGRPRQLDYRHLREALTRQGFSEIRFTGRLVFATHTGTQRVLQRSGRTVFAGALARNPGAFHQLLGAASLPALAHFSLRADLETVHRTLRDHPGSYRLRPVTHSDALVPDLQVDSAEDLEHVWAQLPEGTSRVVLDQVPLGRAASVLAVGGEPVAMLLLTPPAVLGTGRHTLDELVEAKVAARADHPFLRHHPIPETLRSQRSAGQHGTDVPDAGEVVTLTRSPLLSLGADTIGLPGCPFPELAELTRRTLRAVGGGSVASVTLAQPSSGSDDTDASAWAVWQLDPDPVIAQFAYPGSGHTGPVYDAVACELASAAHYRLAPT